MGSRWLLLLLFSLTTSALLAQSSSPPQSPPSQSAAAASEPSVQSLLERIQQLENRITQLEERDRQKEAALAPAPPSAARSSGSGGRHRSPCHARPGRNARRARHHERNPRHRATLSLAANPRIRRC